MKNKLHPRNKHQGRYNLKELSIACPELSQYVKLNPFDPALGETIDFTQAVAVKTLNKALLKFYYNISYWDIPPTALCPPIPGRADYIHYIADLIHQKREAMVLDIGTGANCIYPLIGQAEYQWKFIASDIDQESLNNANKIIEMNQLQEKIQTRWQPNSSSIFKDILNEGELFSLSMCNPPFHSSRSEAYESNTKKWKNLDRSKKKNSPILNFSGTSNELWCNGGEIQFISNMIKESPLFSKQIIWFTTLVSKGENLPHYKSLLKKVNVLEMKIIRMGQGQKISHILAWRF